MSKHKHTRPDAPAPRSPGRGAGGGGKEDLSYTNRPTAPGCCSCPMGAGAGTVSAAERRQLLLGQSGAGASRRRPGSCSPEGWQNTGGDRTWLSPEIEVFFPDYPRCQRHVEPATLDAADYAVDVQDGGVTLARTMTLDFARAERR